MPETNRISRKDVIFHNMADEEMQIAATLRFLTLAVSPRDVENVECKTCKLPIVTIDEPMRAGVARHQILIDTTLGNFYYRLSVSENDESDTDQELRFAPTIPVDIKFENVWRGNRGQYYKDRLSSPFAATKSELKAQQSGLEALVNHTGEVKKQIVEFLDMIESV